MKSSKKVISFLIIILIFTFLIRVYHLSKIPPGFFCDEAERGVSAYLLIKTGRDWHGKLFPIFFKAFGEYTPPLQTYSIIPFILIFGLNEFSVRLASVFWGTIAVLLIFQLGTVLFSPEVGLWSAFFLAIQPWSFHYSRYGGEIMVYMAFFLFALTLFFQALKKEKLWVFAFLVWALTFYTYNPAKLITPLFLIIFLVFNLNRIKNSTKYFKRGIIIFLIISLPFIFHMISGAGFIRFQQVSIFSTDKSLTEKLSLFLERYFTQFSPTYLFLKGDPTFITRHLTEGLTPLLLTQSILIVIGMIFFLRKNQTRKYFLVWITLYPIAGALTFSGPLSSRSIIGAPLFALLSGSGVFLITREMENIFKNKLLLKGIIVLILAIVLINFSFLYNFYLKEYPKKSADFWGWQYGPREIISYFKTVEKDYDELIMSGEFNAPGIFFKFYAPDNCFNCRIGNASLYNPNKNQLFALTPEELKNQKQKYKFEKIIYYPNGKVAFYIVRFIQ